MPDPRVFLAAERTLLAWIRTGLTVMAFGFVLARFGLFLDLLTHQSAIPAASLHSVAVSKFMGISLILVGVFYLFASAIQHRNFLATISPEDMPARYKPGLGLTCAFLLGIVGLFFALLMAFEGAV